MCSLTISMPALTVFESNYTRKKQVRLFVRINNRIDFKNNELCNRLFRDVVSLPGTENSVP